jgi:hypothetical protein
MGHLRCVAAHLREEGLYLIDVGFSTWCMPFWQDPETGWQPCFENGWSCSRGTLDVYHDGCLGRPCDPLNHLCTEYMYFRAIDRETGERQ